MKTLQNNWQNSELGTLIDIYDELRVPISSQERSKIQGQYPYYGASGIIDYINKYNVEGDYLLVAEDGENLKSRSTPIAFWAKGKFWVNNHAHIIKAKMDIADTDFIKYWFSQADISGYITGSAQPKLSQSNLRKIIMNVPDFQTQTYIASVLSNYDDLIENNEKRIKALEEMAQLLYTEWFIKFKFPGHEKVKMVDSGTEYGMIPEGWKVLRFDSEIELVYGKALKEENRVPGDILVCGSGGVVGTHNTKLVSGPGVVVGRKGNAGAVFWVHQDFYPIDTAFFVKSKLPLVFVYYLLKSQNFVLGDSAVPGLSREQAYRNQILVPSTELIDKFKQVANPIKNAMEIISDQSTNLSKARDLLIPQLVKGIENI